jgi:tetratricopeptide (TPR) repeat protein
MLMKYRITGANRATGEDLTIVIDALDKTAAEKWAAENEVIWSDITEVTVPSSLPEIAVAENSIDPTSHPEAVQTAPVPISKAMHIKAEHNHLQATFRLNKCQAHLKVYRTTLPSIANDGLEFIDEALRTNPKSSKYWNTKALLLSDGLRDHARALECLKRALALEPDSIVIKQNIRKIEAAMKGCLATLLILLITGLSTALCVYAAVAS